MSRQHDLHLRGVSTANGNVEALARVIRALVPSATVTAVLVEHDDDCPCAEGDRPMSACTCELVDVTLRRLA
jgi:hypothetical protein